jgi:hypothetical protein
MKRIVMALRTLAAAMVLALAACASLPPPNPIVEQAQRLDRQLGGS